MRKKLFLSVQSAFALMAASCDKIPGTGNSEDTDITNPEDSGDTEGSKCTSTFMANNTMYHIFSVVASSPSSTLTITVKDGFGNTYTETMTRPKPFTIDWD